MNINNRFRYRHLFAIVVFILVLVTAGFIISRHSQSAEGTDDKITIAYATPPYTAVADVAEAQGYYHQEGLDAVVQRHSTGKAALTDVLAGRADFATVAETPIMLAIMNGADISIIATIQSSNKDYAIIARKDRGIQRPDDLKGKTIGASMGTTSEFFLDVFLLSHGISRRDVKATNLQPEEIPDALAKGKIDAASIFVPFFTSAQKQLGDKGVTFYDKEIYTETFNLVSTGGYVRKNPDKVRKVLLALIKAEDFISRNPSESQKAIAGLTKTGMATLRDAWDSNKFSVVLDQSLVLALEDESRWAITNNLTEKRAVPNYLDYIYFPGLESVKPRAVRILR